MNINVLNRQIVIDEIFDKYPELKENGFSKDNVVVYKDSKKHKNKTFIFIDFGNFKDEPYRLQFHFSTNSLVEKFNQFKNITKVKNDSKFLKEFLNSNSKNILFSLSLLCYKRFYQNQFVSLVTNL